MTAASEPSFLSLFGFSCTVGILYRYIGNKTCSVFVALVKVLSVPHLEYSCLGELFQFNSCGMVFFFFCSDLADII